MINNTEDSQKILQIYNSLVDDEYIDESLFFSDKGLIFSNFLLGLDYELLEGFSPENKFDYITIRINDKENLKEKLLNENIINIDEKENNILKLKMN